MSGKDGDRAAGGAPFMFWRGWTGPKPGQDHTENQDAYETRPVRGVPGGGMLLALCDGAGSTVYAGPWARALAAAVQFDWPDLDDAGLKARLDEVRERSQQAQPDDLPWYMAHKLAREGSQAAFLAVAFAPAPDTAEVGFRAVAVGDCTLILFRCDGSVESFPLSESGQFGLSPQLVSTKPQPNLRYERWDGSVKPGELAVACTDAVGKWILEGVEAEDRAPIFRLLLDLVNGDGQREAGERPTDSGLFPRIAQTTPQRPLHEDDVTVVLCVPAPPSGVGTPHDVAVATLNSHLTGDFSGLYPAQPGRPAWVAAIVSLLRRAYPSG